jgi:hypothetical protein
MIRRRLLLVERSLHGGAAELQETELPSLPLLPFFTLDAQGTVGSDNEIRNRSSKPSAVAAQFSDGDSPSLPFSFRTGASGGPFSVGIAERKRLSPPEVTPMRAVTLPRELSAPQVAERIWEAVDEGNRVVLIGRLFELSKHPDCFRGVAIDTTLVRKPWCLVAVCTPGASLIVPPCRPRCDPGTCRRVPNGSSRAGLSVVEQGAEATSVGSHAPYVPVPRAA